MKVAFETDTAITVTALDEPGLVTDAPAQSIDAIALFATSFASCTYAVLASYAQRIEADASSVSVRLAWQYADRPLRIGRLNMDICWPTLPESRLDAAQRAAMMCTLHNTLKDAVDVEIFVHN